jgi:hypothetical protein
MKIVHQPLPPRGVQIDTLHPGDCFVDKDGVLGMVVDYMRANHVSAVNLVTGGVYHASLDTLVTKAVATLTYELVP